MALIEFDHLERPEPNGRRSDDVRIFGDDIDDVFIELYVQHVEYVRRIAQAQTASHADAEDITAEVFASLLLAMRNGRGPIDQPRPYLQACVRNEIARSRVRGGRDRLVSTDPDDIEAVVNGDDVVLAEDITAERETVTRAFSALSRRHRTVLVATEVEGRSHADIGKQLRMSPPAVAALAKRAREAFAHAYLDEHLNPATGDCRMVRRTLPAMIRGTVTPRRRRRVHDHLEQCPLCSAAHEQLAHVNKVLRSLPTVTLAAGATAGRTGWFASLKDLLGIGGDGAGTTGATGGMAPVAIGASGIAGIPQVLSIATLTLGALVVTSDAPTSDPGADAASDAGAGSGDAPVNVADPLPLDVPATPAVDETRASTVVVERDRAVDADHTPPPHSRRPDDRGDGSGVGAAASPRASVGTPSTVAEPAEGQTSSPSRSATDAPVRPSSTTTSPRATGDGPSATTPPAPAAPQPTVPPATTTPPAAAVLPPAPSLPPVEQITDAVDQTVGGITDVAADTVDGVVTAGGQTVKDLGTTVDDVLTGASLPALVGPVTEPLAQTLEQSGAVVRGVTDAVDGTVDGATDIVDGLLGAEGLVDVDHLTNQLLGP